MKLALTLLVITSPLILTAQTKDLSIFDNLVGKTWYAEGKWGDGSSFKQQVHFEYNLGDNIVIAKSDGFTNQEQTAYGNRNLGIRKLDAETGEINFWEFDVFGGLTEGEVKAAGKNILYQYQYGESFITDMWEYVNDSTYNFMVGDYKDGKWNQVYLKTTFNRISKKAEKSLLLDELSEKLVGTWQSKAWDGMLYETWSISQVDGHLQQEAKYVENGKVSYQAMNKMEVLNNELVLFTVIQGNNPKIFKATTLSSRRVVFENSDYANPNRVEYIFEADSFRRTIIGIENGKPTSYTFDFSRKE
ncbi:MAG: hypothetical protein AAGF85_15010 [Bacteroidota bacterium]